MKDEQLNKLVSMGTEDDPVLYAIYGDISPKAEYSPCVLLATKTHIFTYDFTNDEVYDKYAF